jgi:hypothetical protein
MKRKFSFLVLVAVAASLIVVAPALAQDAPDSAGQPHKKQQARRADRPRQVDNQAAIPAQPKVREDRRAGRLHDRLRRSREREQNARKDAESGYAEYLDLKNTLEGAGITYSFQPTLMSQWGWPNGGRAALQGLASVPAFNFDFPDSPTVGQGSIQFSYGLNRYFNGQNGAAVTGNIGPLTPINDSPTNGNLFAQLTYTHEFPGKYLELVFGQFPFFNFDYNAYAGDQQTNFVNYAFSQNGSAAYILASLGGYAQINPVDTLSFVVGAQDANNITGQYIQTRTFGEGPWAWFASAQWTPVSSGPTAGQYNLLYYQQPAVTAQPLSAQGWSFNGVQNLNATWGLFARLNTSSGAISQIKTSAAGGFIYNNPLGREPNDRIGVGLAWNITNQAAFVGQSVRASELVIDTYWNFVVKKWLQLGPDFQFIVDPALHPNLGSAEVLTLRMTGLF